MKNRILSLVAALACVATSFAQMAQIATLNHNGEISAFYGADALIAAMDAADHGDVISLSSGRFNAVDITKAVILRGTGMFASADADNPHDPTLVVNSFKISITDSVTHKLKVEGINFNNIYVSEPLDNAQFSKCKIATFSFNYNNSKGRSKNMMFIHCRLGSVSCSSCVSTMSFYNCIIKQFSNLDSADKSTITYDNCYVYLYGTNQANNAYRNSIITTNGNRNVNSYSSADHCVGYGGKSIFEGMASANHTNQYISDLSSFFKYYTGHNGNLDIWDSDNFELTETAASTYLGADGTQVGIYGGSLPYEEAPLLPQITKCQVASKTTADGKLSVDIEVKAADY